MELKLDSQAVTVFPISLAVLKLQVKRLLQSQVYDNIWHVGGDLEHPRLREQLVTPLVNEEHQPSDQPEAKLQNVSKGITKP